MELKNTMNEITNEIESINNRLDQSEDIICEV